jgi:hypothetical protein
MDVIRIHVHARHPARNNAADSRVLIFTRLFTASLDLEILMMNTMAGATQRYSSAFL